MAKKKISVMWRDEFLDWVSTQTSPRLSSRHKNRQMKELRFDLDKLSYKHWRLLSEGLMKGPDSFNVNEHLAPSAHNREVQDNFGRFLETGIPSDLSKAISTIYLNDLAPLDPEAARDFYDRDVAERRREWEGSVYEALMEDLVVLDELETPAKKSEIDEFEVLEELEATPEIENAEKKAFIQRMREDKETFRIFMNECREDDPEDFKAEEDEFHRWYEENVKLEQSAIAIMDAEFTVQRLKQQKAFLTEGSTERVKMGVERSINDAKKQLEALYEKDAKLRDKTLKDLDKRADKGTVSSVSYEYRRNQLLRGNLLLTPESYLKELESRERANQESSPQRTQLDLSGRITSQTNQTKDVPVPQPVAEKTEHQKAPENIARQEEKDEVEEIDCAE